MRAVVIVVLVVAAAVVVAVVVARHRQAQEAERRAGAPRRDPLAGVHGNEDYLYRLKVGDVVHHEATDFLVRGTLRFDEDGYTWAEHLIGDGASQHWLTVEDDEGLNVVLWQRVPIAQLQGEPGARSVEHEGVAYELVERGEAAFTAEGTTGTAPSGRAQYVDYRAADGRHLSCERFGTTWEVSVGHTVQPRTLDIYPVSR